MCVCVRVLVLLGDEEGRAWALLPEALSHCMTLQVTMLSSFLIELAQVDASMLKYSYSMQSAAALYVAMRTFGEIPDCNCLIAQDR